MEPRNIETSLEKARKCIIRSLIGIAISAGVRVYVCGIFHIKVTHAQYCRWW